MQNEANFKYRIQNTEYRMQNKKMCINNYSIKDCATIFPANCLGCAQEVIGGLKGNEPNLSPRERTQFRLVPKGFKNKVFPGVGSPQEASIMGLWEGLMAKLDG